MKINQVKMTASLVIILGRQERFLKGNSISSQI